MHLMEQIAVRFFFHFFSTTTKKNPDGQTIQVLRGGDRPLTTQEIRFRDAIEAHHVRLNSSTALKAKLAEVVQLEKMKQSRPVRTVTTQHIDYRSTFSALNTQREGLDLLTKCLREDTEAMKIILRR